MSPARRSRQHYLKQADQAEQLARRATSPSERQSLEEIARLWRRLAETAPSDPAG